MIGWLNFRIQLKLMLGAKKMLVLGLHNSRIFCLQAQFFVSKRIWAAVVTFILLFLKHVLK
jgi:hypothetical protein